MYFWWQVLVILTGFTFKLWKWNGLHQNYKTVLIWSSWKSKCKAPLSGYKLIVLIVTITKTNNNIQGMKLIFFSDSHLAAKFFKVVANSKKGGCHFQRQTKPFFYAVNVLDGPSKINLGKRSNVLKSGH